MHNQHVQGMVSSFCLSCFVSLSLEPKQISLQYSSRRIQCSHCFSESLPSTQSFGKRILKYGIHGTSHVYNVPYCNYEPMYMLEVGLNVSFRKSSANFLLLFFFIKLSENPSSVLSIFNTLKVCTIIVFTCLMDDIC